MSDKFELQMKVPAAPNFVRLIAPGVDEPVNVPVSELSDAQKDWLAHQWRLQLDLIADAQRKEKK